jgi:cytochrome c556
MHRVTIGLAGLVAVVGIGAGSLVQAQGALDERQQFMKSLGQYAYNRQFRADAAQAANLPKVAAAADEMAAKMPRIPALFPAGSIGGNALPAIWERPAEFQAATDKATELSKALAAAARTGDVQASQAAFQALTQQGCNGCHGTFQKPRS